MSQGKTLPMKHVGLFGDWQRHPACLQQRDTQFRGVSVLSPSQNTEHTFLGVFLSMSVLFVQQQTKRGDFHLISFFLTELNPGVMMNGGRGYEVVLRKTNERCSIVDDGSFC